MKSPVFQDHNLMDMDPLVAQEKFKPTDANPVSLHKQMAGDPFVSQAQRGFMYSQHPKLAAEFEAKTPKGKKLPRHVRGKR